MDKRKNKQRNIGKVFITGIYGSGKTTLAKKIAKKINCEYFELDNFKYIRYYDKIRSVEERKNKISKIIKSNQKWVFEGSWLDYAKELYEKADLVIYLDTPEWKLYHRICLRWIKRKLTVGFYPNKTEKKFGLNRNTWKYYHDEDYYFNKEKHLKYIKKYSNSFIIIKNNNNLDLFKILK